MPPNILDGLQDTDSGELAGVVVTVDVKTLDESSDARKLVALLQPVQRKKVPGKRASVDIVQVVSVLSAGLGECDAE